MRIFLPRKSINNTKPGYLKLLKYFFFYVWFKILKKRINNLDFTDNVLFENNIKIFLSLFNLFKA